MYVRSMLCSRERIKKERNEGTDVWERVVGIEEGARLEVKASIQHMGKLSTYMPVGFFGESHLLSHNHKQDQKLGQGDSQPISVKI